MHSIEIFIEMKRKKWLKVIKKHDNNNNNFLLSSKLIELYKTYGFFLSNLSFNLLN